MEACIAAGMDLSLPQVDGAMEDNITYWPNGLAVLQEIKETLLSSPLRDELKLCGHVEQASFVFFIFVG